MKTKGVIILEKKLIIGFFTFLVGLLACFHADSGFCKEITIGAGLAPANAIFKPIKEPFEKSTGIKLNLIEGGAVIALQDLINGRIDAASAPLTLEEWCSLVESKGMAVDKSNLEYFIIGVARAVVIVHPSNPINKLSKEQLKDIFSGKITKWKEVGGSDMPITIAWSKSTPGTNELYYKRVLQDIKITTNNMKSFATAFDLKEFIASNADAVGITSASIIDKSVKVIDQPEASSPIFLVVKKGESSKVTELLDFIKTEGGKYIK